MPATLSEGYAPGCIGRIAALHASYYARASGFGVEFEAKVATELSRFCLRCVPGRDGLWLARETEVEGSIVIDASHVEAEGAHLRWFITSDALRGQGVGRRLLAQAMDFCDARGYRKVFLWTFEGLDAARHLYEGHGFRLVDQREGTTWGRRVNEQRFERRTA
ncbi:N-acetyltransferase [Aquabacterium sp. J223]|uniref:GNAT family N-acetyltransferase n=1 Tax=Aquabacterium sp. J223 TaxID=2898431 RepID=UPI0021AD5D14|nr:GNAT family N-acetyltransferase [Aquabacterium sp. J223]UUX94380.1 GNAT family N-acetyltransferase [Aquabacterium sp. J223]